MMITGPSKGYPHSAFHYPETYKQDNEVEPTDPSLLPYQFEAGQGDFAHIHWTSFCNVDKPCFQNCHST